MHARVVPADVMQYSRAKLRWNIGEERRIGISYSPTAVSWEETSIYRRVLFGDSKLKPSLKNGPKSDPTSIIERTDTTQGLQ